MEPFRYAHAAGEDWRAIVSACLEQIGPVPAAANLAFLYVTDALAEDLDELLEVRFRPGRAWVRAYVILSQKRTRRKRKEERKREYEKTR